MTATVILEGQRYEGWKSVSVSRSLEQTAASFNLSIHDRWKDVPSWSPWPIHAGKSCDILLDNILVVTGNIDNHQISYSARDHGQQVSGRSKTGDLIDSSVIEPGGEYRDQTIDAILRNEAGKFDIDLIVEGDVGAAFPKVRLNLGETPAELGDRLARNRGLLLTDTPEGALKLLEVQPGAPVAKLVEGVNILQASATHKADERFSEYHIKGQQPGTGQAFGEQAAQVRANAQDPYVKRYRPLLVIAEHPGDREDMRARADWEAARRAAESLEASVTVQGWQYAPGQLWQPGLLVQLQSPMLAVNRTMVIKNWTATLADGAGTLTNLQLAVPESMSRQPASGSSAQGAAPSSGGSEAPATGGSQAEDIWSNTRPTAPAI